MANRDPSKTEKPTAKVINQARKSGNVLMSNDINSVLVVLVSTVLIFWTFSLVLDGFHNIFTQIGDIDTRTNWEISQIHHGTIVGLRILSTMLVPILLGIVGVGIIASRAQTGHYFETESLHWKLTSLNPVNGLKSILPSVDNFVKLLLTLAKVSIIALLIFIHIRSEMNSIISLPLQALESGISWVLYTAMIVVLKIVAFFAILAIIDYIWKRKKYYENLMMTKQEVKDERKDAEGDPVVKGKIRQKMRELTMMRMIVEVPKADVVVTNPIHVAVALRYDPGSIAPKIVARGLRKRAQRIKELAANANVPIVEDPPLARALYAKAGVGMLIPKELYGAVAAILAKLHAESNDH